jgi:ParB-like chromosome segregation protein Spo0J
MLKQLCASLKEFGFVQPIVARAEDGLVVGGHQRLTAYDYLLKQEGYADAERAKMPVPCVLPKGLSEARTKSLNLALNKISGEWDYTKLADVLDSIKDAPALDLTGFSTDEITEVLSTIGASINLPVLPNEEADEDIADTLATNERRMVIVMPTKEDAVLVKGVLADYGMTSPKQGGEAMVKVIRDLLNFKKDAPTPVAAPKAKKGAK